MGEGEGGQFYISKFTVGVMNNDIIRHLDIIFNLFPSIFSLLQSKRCFTEDTSLSYQLSY
jgi:hypothetical protein